jgi:hypothetical protein
MMDDKVPSKGDSKKDDPKIAELLELLANSEWLLEITIRLKLEGDSDQKKPT